MVHPGSAHAGSFRTAALDDESRYDPVPGESVVEAGLGPA